MQIPQEGIEKVLGIYKPRVKYLVEAHVEYPHAIGSFIVGPTFYTVKSLEHITNIEAQICLNQLGYAAFAAWMEEGKLEGLEMSYDGFFNLMSENQKIIDSELQKGANIKFKKPINPETLINTEIELTKFKKRRNLYVALVDFNMESGKAKGNLKFTLNL